MAAKRKGGKVKFPLLTLMMLFLLTGGSIWTIPGISREKQEMSFRPKKLSIINSFEIY